jgi:hypothetical protein
MRAMKRNPVLLSILLVSVVLFSACSTTYAPSTGAADPKLLPNMKAGTHVALVNAQPSTEKVLVGDAGMGRKVYANLHEWTENAITGIRKSLQKKGVVVDPAAGKSLKVAVTKAQFEEAGGGWAFRATIAFTIETSDGAVSKLYAQDNSWKFLNACDGAMDKLPLAALTDPAVVKFLNGSDASAALR